MVTAVYYLACDLGTESVRVVLGALSKGQLTLREVHSFPTRTHLVKGQLCWDLVSLEKELFSGIEKAALLDVPIASLSADSWGIDYILLDEENRPLQSPVCSEARRTEDAVARLLKKLPLATIYAETGVSLQPLHTLFQIEAEYLADATLFQRAERFLPIADYFNTRFSGMAVCEQSLASTTQLYNPQSHAWSPKLVAALDLPGSILPRLVPSGTVFGPVAPELRRHPSFFDTRAIATCSLDTAAAIAAVPARPEQRWAFLHSDNRSQFGVELRAPNMSSHAREAGFTNEAGLDGSIHFLKDCAGLGLLWECRRVWAATGQTYSEEDLSRMAIQNGPAQAHLCVPGDIPASATRPTCPARSSPTAAKRVSPSQNIRVKLSALFSKASRWPAPRRSGNSKRSPDMNSKCSMLWAAAPATISSTSSSPTRPACTVIAWTKADAAAIGNILIQALALWHIKSPDHLRSIVSSSFPTRILKPGQEFDPAIRDKFQALSERLRVLGSAR